MLNLSVLLFALAAVLGLVILRAWMTNKGASDAVVYGHGIAAVAAVVLLLLFALDSPSRTPLISLCLFGVAAVAGLYLFIRDRQNKPSPISLAAVHALVAVGGFVVLLLFAFA